MLPYSKLRDPKRSSMVPQLPLPMPWAMWIELTNRCNFKCKFCPESIEDYVDRVGGISKMTFEQYVKICDDILSIGKLRAMRFYMLGEPLLHNELPQFIKYAKDHGVSDRIELTSNGTALTESKANQLLEAGLDYLRISIYAMNPDRHANITQNKIDPRVIRDNVRTLYKLRNERGLEKPYICAKMINPFDASEEALLHEYYDDCTDEVIIEQPQNWNNPDGVDFIDNVYTEKIDRKQLFPYPKDVCPLPFYTLVVHSSGDVSVCCVDWEKKTVVGNIYNQSLREIWTGKPLMDFQRMQIERRRDENEACKNCTLLYTLPDNIDEITSFDALYEKQVHTK